MLPARSHVTSDGRLKPSPLMPDPAGLPALPPPPPPPPPPPAACRAAARREKRRVRRGRRHAGTGPQRDVLGLAAEHQLESSVGVELHDLVRSGVDDPHVVLRIDAHLLREVDRVDALSDLLHELAGLIELKQARAAVIERALVAERRHGVARSRVDEHVAARVGRDARHLAVRRQRDDVGVGVVVDLRNRLGEQRAALPAAAPMSRRSVRFMMDSYLPADVLAACGRRMIFCTRHCVISDTYISSGIAAIHLVDAAEFLEPVAGLADSGR